MISLVIFQEYKINFTFNFWQPIWGYSDSALIGKVKNNAKFFARIVRVLVLASFVLLFSGFSAYAQEPLYGFVKLNIDKGNLEGTQIIITENGKAWKNVSPSKARYEYDLDYGNEYLFTFTKPGYITKKIIFNTKVPKDRIAEGFVPFPFIVTLFKQYDDINTVVFNQPVGIIGFSLEVDDFDYDTDYTKSIQAALREVEEQIAEKRKEEDKAEALARKAAAAQVKAEEARQKKAEVGAKKNADAEAAAQEAARKKTEQEAKNKVQADAKALKAAAAQAKAEEARKKKAEEEVKKKVDAEVAAEKAARKKAEEEAQNKVQAAEKAANAAAKEAAEDEKNKANTKSVADKAARKKAAEESKAKAASKKAAEAEARKTASDEEKATEEARKAAAARDREEEASRNKGASDYDYNLVDKSAEKAEKKAAREEKAAEDIRKVTEARKSEEENTRIAAAAEAKAKAALNNSTTSNKAGSSVRHAARMKAAADAKTRAAARAKLVTEHRTRLVDKSLPNERKVEFAERSNRKITKVIIRREGLITTYRKVEHVWGGVYYFREIDNITKIVFDLETTL